jgi:hypothetical protein
VARDCRELARVRLYDSFMALRIHPMTASRWAELSATRLPIDLTRAEQLESDRGWRIRSEVERIQAFVDALDSRASASR